MGMNFSPMYQPVSTKTIKADGDLDVNPYDVLAVDGKFDTLEADEFVGGVGNFTSGIVSGGFDVSGILHAESNLQVDGGISLEGSINNVNITPEGEITTTQSINAPEFAGNVGSFTSIKYSGLLSTTPNGTAIYTIPSMNTGSFSDTASLGQLTYPKKYGLIDISEASVDGGITLTFTCTRSTTSGAGHVYIAKDGVEVLDVSMGIGISSANNTISIPYGDNSIWTCRGTGTSGSAPFTCKTATVAIYLVD